jgi:ATP-dependent RNA helicase SUPV3L1/SUV3
MEPLLGVYCSLRTGQEKREVPFAAHVSATMETLRLHEEVDVAVIDEIQMIAHPERGHAWTR